MKEAVVNVAVLRFSVWNSEPIWADAWKIKKQETATKRKMVFPLCGNLSVWEGSAFLCHFSLEEK
jgi:hypothetical protein